MVRALRREDIWLAVRSLAIVGLGTFWIMRLYGEPIAVPPSTTKLPAMMASMLRSVRVRLRAIGSAPGIQMGARRLSRERRRIAGIRILASATPLLHPTLEGGINSRPSESWLDCRPPQIPGRRTAFEEWQQALVTQSVLPDENGLLRFALRELKRRVGQ